MSTPLSALAVLPALLAMCGALPVDSAVDVMGMLRGIANDRRIHSIKTFSEILSFPHNASALDRLSSMLHVIDESLVSDIQMLYHRVHLLTDIDAGT